MAPLMLTSIVAELAQLSEGFYTVNVDLVVVELTSISGRTPIAARNHEQASRGEPQDTCGS